MNRKNIVVNTLVFLQDLNNGKKQSEFFKDIHELDISKVEVRREFIKDFENELNEIKNLSNELNIELYYSIPGYLYFNGELNLYEIEKYFKEANKMDCKNVKLNIGDYNKITNDNVLEINKLCDKYSIKLTIENDQTKKNGKIHKIKKFIEEARNSGMKISCTFDIGNWLWQNEDPKENAYKLKPYITYIHLKDINTKGELQTCLLDEGVIPWRSILSIFNKNIPIAIEYPCCQDAFSRLKKEISKLDEFN